VSTSEKKIWYRFWHVSRLQKHVLASFLQKFGYSSLLNLTPRCKRGSFHNLPYALFNVRRTGQRNSTSVPECALRSSSAHESCCFDFWA